MNHHFLMSAASAADSLNERTCRKRVNNSSTVLKSLILSLLMMLGGGVWAQEPYDVSFNLKTDGASVFDGSVYGTTDYRGKRCNVTLTNHRFVSGAWTGVCFPFPISSEVLNTTFGEGNYEIQQLKNIADDGKTLVFEKTTAIVAGKPYFMRVTATIPSPLTFNNVTIESSVPDSYFTDANSTSSLVFRGFYFPKYMTDMYDQNGANNLYEITSVGTLNSPKDHFVTNEYGGLFAYIFVEGNSVVPVAQLEGAGSGGGGGESGGGGDTPTPSAWDTKIANHEQLTDVPTLYITIPDVVNLDTDLKKDKSVTPWQADYHTATLQVVDNSDESSAQHLGSFTETGLQIKVRGNSTADPSKRPYRLKFDKDEKDPVTGKKTGVTHKHDLLGYGYSKRNWTLLANTFDATMLRNALTYHLNKALDMDFCPGYKFVDLVINGDYRGTYQVSDHVEADKNRVNVDEDTGWMFEFARADMTEDPKFTKPLPGSIKNPDFDDLTTEEQAALQSEIQTWLNAWGAKFTNDTFTSATTGWRSVNDEESLVNFYIGINITGDYDGFMTVKTYKGADGKMYCGPIWDKDLAYGNYSLDDGETLVENQPNGNFRLYIKGDGNCLYKDPKFIAKVKQRLDQLIDGGLVASLRAKVDELATLTAQTRAKNYERWDISGTNTLNNVGKYHDWDYDDFSKYTDQLKDYLTNHIAWFKQQIDAQYASVTASAGNLSYDPTSRGDWDTGHTYTSLYSYKNSNRNLTVSPIETVTGTGWRTIYLPFDYTEAQMTALIGEYDLREFSGMDGSTFQFTIPSSKAVNSCVPYLIKLKNASAVTATSLNFGNVFISFGTEAENSFAEGDFNVTGILHAKQLETNGTNYILSTDGNLVQLPAGQYVNEVYNRADVLNGLQAYFVVPNDVTPSVYIEPESAPIVRTQKNAGIPTIYIDTEDGADINPSTGDYVNAEIEVIDASNSIEVFSENKDEAGKYFLEVRGRGTWDATAGAKNSYRLKFAKKHKHKMLASDGYDKRNWVLLSNTADPTMLRNALATELGGQMGFAFTPGCRFVDLIINDVYAGTYQVTDFVEADAARVNVDEDTGWLLEMSVEDKIDKREFDGDVYVAGSSDKPWVNVKNPEPSYKDSDTDDVKRTAIAGVTTPVNDFFTALWGDFENKADRQTLVDWYIATEILGSDESLLSVFGYKEADAAMLKFGPLWNNDLAFDNSSVNNMITLMGDKDTDGSYNAMAYKTAAASPWKAKLESLWSANWFASAVNARWAELYNGGTGDLQEALLTKLNTLKDDANLQASVTSNYASAPNGAGRTLTGTYADAVGKITAYINARFPYLDKKFKAMNNSVIVYDVTKADPMEGLDSYNDQEVNVTLKNRGTIWGGEWNALCLPFDAGASTVEAVFGADVVLKTFSSVVRNSDTDIQFSFTEVSSKNITAGTPYLIKPAANVVLEDKVFEGVTFKATSAQTTTVDNDGDYKYVGTLLPTTIAANKYNLVLLRNNTLYKLSSPGTLTACRAYFVIPESAANANSFSFAVDDTATAIRGWEQGIEREQKVYNLNGQLVGFSLRGLPAGVYIVNGKKIVK